MRRKISAVDQEQRQADQSEEGEIGQDVKNGEQAQDEQHTEEGYALAVGDLLGFGKADLQDAAFAAQSQRGDADQTDQCKGQNHAEELTGRQLIARVQEQILWVADRCDHTAEVCRDRLQDDDRDEQRALTDQTEYQNGEGDEGDERDVVCDGHGGKEGQKGQEQDDGAQRVSSGEQLLREQVEHIVFLHAGHNRHQAEQQDEHAGVYVTKISRGRRREKHGDDRADQGGGQNRFSVDECAQGMIAHGGLRKI